MRPGLADRVASCVGLSVIALLIVAAALAPVIAPYDPTAGALGDRLIPPFWQSGGSPAHLLGTDVLGRDTFSRLIYGVRTSLAVAIVAIFAAGTVGSLVGIVAGYLGGWVDAILMRAADLAFSFPTILLAMVLAVVLGASFLNVVLVIGLVLWAEYARMARGETLKVREMDYVALAEVAGVSKSIIVFRHLLPNVAGSLIVLATLQVGVVIILEASLSFLGVGLPPPTPDWGAMVAEGRSYVVSAWWLSLVPGIAILITVMAFNLLGETLVQFLSPERRV